MAYATPALKTQNVSDRLNGFAVESLLERLIIAIGGKKVIPPRGKLLSVLHASEEGRKRLSLAYPHLIREYDSIGNTPSIEILDRCFGIDHLFQYRGWLIAIDSTANNAWLPQKTAKMQSLAHLYEGLGIDKFFALKPTRRLTPDGFKSILSTIIKQS